MEKRRQVTNTTDKLWLVFTEPEAQDYWLRPGETVEVRASVDNPDDDFEIHDTPDGMTFWPANSIGYISVWSDNIELGCGYQRPPGWA